MMTSFPITMAWREARASWSRFVFFFICIAIGVGAIVGVGLFATNVENVILRDARSLLGGDLEISSRRQLSDAGHRILDSLASRGIAISNVSQLAAMAADHDEDSKTDQATLATQLVELKAVDEFYPFYGTVEVDPPAPLSGLLSSQNIECSQAPCYGAIVQESLLISLGLERGREVKIGQAVFKITGILLKEPDRVASAFSLGPRVIISREGLTAAELVKRGSRIRERYLLRVPDHLAIQPLLGELRGRFGEEGVRVSTYKDAQPRIRRFLDQLSTYLGLIGLTVLFVGGIGVACTIQGFLSQKMTSIAILKTIGADAKVIMYTYLFQSMMMGSNRQSAGSRTGNRCAIPPTPAIEGITPLFLGLSPLTPSDSEGHCPRALIDHRLHALAPLDCSPCSSRVGSFDGKLISPILWENQHHSSDRTRDFLKGFVRDRFRMATGLAIGIGMAGLATWQARSLTLGLFFVAAFLVALHLADDGREIVASPDHDDGSPSIIYDS